MINGRNTTRLLLGSSLLQSLQNQYRLTKLVFFWEVGSGGCSGPRRRIQEVRQLVPPQSVYAYNKYSKVHRGLFAIIFFSHIFDSKI